MKIVVTRDEFAEMCGHCEVIKDHKRFDGGLMHCESCVLNRVCEGQNVSLFVTEIAMPMPEDFSF